jgi:hypothetical protein
MAELWKNLKSLAEAAVPPKKMLLKHAAELTTAADGWLQAEVMQATGGDQLRWELTVRVPALDDYRVELLWVRHPATLYPATVYSEWVDTNVEKCESPEALEAAVEKRLASDAVQRAVGALLAQAQAQ